MKTKLLFIGLASTGFASATSIVQSLTTGAYLAGNPQTFTFDKFDTRLGALTGVSVGFSFDKTGGSLAVDNDGAVGGSVLFRQDVEAYLSSSVDVGSTSIDSPTLARSSTTIFLAATDGDNTSQFDVGGSDYAVYNASNKKGTYATESISAGSWGAYTNAGNGTLDIDFITIQSYSASGAGGLQTLGLASSVAPTVTVTYTYIAAVPETSFALIGGLGFLALFRRRR